MPFCFVDGNASEAIEMRVKPLNGDVQRNLKEANNLRRPCDTGMTIDWFLDLLISQV